MRLRLRGRCKDRPGSEQDVMNEKKREEMNCRIVLSFSFSSSCSSALPQLLGASLSRGPRRPQHVFCTSRWTLHRHRPRASPLRRETAQSFFAEIPHTSQCNSSISSLVAGIVANLTRLQSDKKVLCPFVVVEEKRRIHTHNDDTIGTLFFLVVLPHHQGWCGHSWHHS